jgi:MoaA/NifB/PqqE/SkfB family radical SAM enzyme
MDGVKSLSALSQMGRSLRAARRRFREARMVADSLKSARHPILVHIVPIRRCNLSCTYCNEFDDYSKPVPIDQMLRRIDLLAALGAKNITLSGGEPLLHPQIVEIIARVRQHGILAGLITNGYLLSPERIHELNRAGLDHLQISVDNVQPDAVSVKSLKVLDKKLAWLAKYADFAVNVNSVLGSSISSPGDALIVARRARKLQLSSTIGVIHDGGGQLQPLNAEQQQIYREFHRSQPKRWFEFERYNTFQQNLIKGLPNDWQCGAGSRYLYVCEDGLVHYCSQQRGRPGIPLEQYTQEDLDREYRTTKACAPYCTVSCVHRVAAIDRIRQDPVVALQQFFPEGRGSKKGGMPRAVRALTWLFLPPPGDRRPRVAGRLLLRMLGVR